MRKSFLLLTLTTILMLSACAVSETTRQEKAVRQALLKQEIANALRERHYQIDVDCAFPEGRGRVINLTSEYSLTVSGDTIISYLPFFGRAYSVPYGGGSGLNFTGIIRGYAESVTRKGEHLISLDVESAEDYYRYEISIFDNGKATVGVSPRQRSHMYFTGVFHE